MDSHELRLVEPEIRSEEILRINDVHFDDSNVALVTGAASGIGRALALALAANGLSVLCVDVNQEGLLKTAEKATTLGTTIRTVTTDLTSLEDMEACVQEALTLGQIRYLANVAGMQHVDSIEDFPVDTFDNMESVMLRAPFYLSKLCIPHMKASCDGVGVVANMCSVHGHVATKNKVAYNMAKFGLRGLTQSIAAEGEGKVRAFSVSVGYVKTALVLQQIPDQARQRHLSPDRVVSDVMLGKSQVKEMMNPIDVANLFVFGFSHHGRFLVGNDLLFDGGMVQTY